MTIIIRGFKGPPELLVTRGYAGTGVGPALVAYVDPTAVTVLPQDTTISDVDPTAVLVIQ